MNPINQKLNLSYKPNQNSAWSPGNLGKLKANSLGSKGTSSARPQTETFTTGRHAPASPTSFQSNEPASSNWGSPGQINSGGQTSAQPPQAVAPQTFSLTQPQLSNQNSGGGACMGPLLCEQEPILAPQDEPTPQSKGPSPQFLANLAAENQTSILNTWKVMNDMNAENRQTGASIADINAAVAQEISDMGTQSYMKRVGLENKNNQQMVYLFSEVWPDP